MSDVPISTVDTNDATSDNSNETLSEQLESLRNENQRLKDQLLHQQKQRDSAARHSLDGDTVQLEFIQAQQELSRCKEALMAMKADRKRLNSEKSDLVSQIKQLYGTLKDKESELRDFIRNYEQRMRETNDVITQLNSEKDRLEKDWREAMLKNEQLSDQLAAVQAELRAKDSIITKYRLLATKAKLPLVEVPRSTNSSHNNSINDDSLLGTSGHQLNDVINISYNTSAEELPPYQEIFHVGHHRRHPAAVPATVAEVDDDVICRTSSVSEGRPLNHRRRLLGHRASQLAFNISSQRQQQQQQMSQYRHNSFTGTTSSGVYSTLSSNDYNAAGSSMHVLPAPRRTTSFLVQRGAENQQATLEQAHRLPVCEWRASHVLAWLELDMNMAAYGQACFDNIKSGKILLGLSDAELETALRLESSLHRRKMRLAIEELRDPATVQYPNASKLDQIWIAHEWLHDLGLTQYSTAFESQLVDGRLLNVLGKKDLDKHLSVHNKFHQSSILHAIQLLRLVRFDIQVLKERRERCQDENNDVIVWTNQRLKQWADEVDLHEYAEKLKDNGVHGAVIVLDMTFTADMLANLLGIPNSKSYVRRHLVTEFDVIVHSARMSLELNKKTGNSKSTLVRSHSGGSAAHGDSSNRGSSRRLSFKGSLVRALRGRTSSRELPSPSSQNLSSSSAS